MKELSRVEIRRIEDIEAHLGALHLGAGSVVAEIIPAVRQLLDADNAIFYSLGEHEAGWRIERWHHDGDLARLRDLLGTAVAASAEVILYYDPRAPALWMRNRVIEVTSHLDGVEGPGSWLKRPVCRDVFRPASMERHKHLRTLVCDGSDLLGWLGTLVPETPDPHHFQLLSALVPAFQRRLSLERRLGDAPRSLRALEASLDAIGAPAFIVSAAGAIVMANAPGRTMLEERRAELAQAIADVHARRANALGLELTPITANGVPSAWLAIVRSQARDARLRLALARARARWTLTARQQAVLARIVRGDSNVTIAAALDVSARAIEQHVTALLDHAGVDSRAALVASVLAF